MSKIKDITPCLRPREKALNCGISSLSDRELLALFIRSGTREASALDIADIILKQYGSLSQICYLDIYELMKIKGIKKAKAIEICAIVELIKRMGVEDGRKVVSIKDASDVYRIFKVELENESQERFMVIFLNVKLSIIKKELLFLGGESTAFIDINLLLCKCQHRNAFFLGSLLD